jgi:2-polyprenyl-3-methyl-5-hydroxy-6-metoxy-1,4-benzoquinol methylase
MNLLDLLNRSYPPEPWAEGEKIPWNDPAFSQRMLQEHLSQEHDAASRRTGKIDQHVLWIHQAVLGSQPSHILDLGCGPGLYSSRLARLGHTCTGIDFSPASIAYARQQAQITGLDCTYHESDLRQADFGQDYDLVMFIFGEFNVFHPDHARLILEKSFQALKPGGRLLLEVHTLPAVQNIGQQLRSWYSALSGLFSDRPHLCLTESFWDARQKVAIERFFIVDAASNTITRHAASTQAYTETEYQALIEDCGFSRPQFFTSLCGHPDETQPDLFVLVSQKT